MSGPVVPRIRRSDLSATCRAAADASAVGQRRTKLLVRIELVGLVLAGVAGLQSLRVGTGGIDVLAAVAGTLFLVSLAALTFRGLTRPEEQWYLGRAGAESVRTMAWRFAVGGDPFPCGLSPAKASDAFLFRLSEILAQLSELTLPKTPADDREITDAMRQVREAPFQVRREVYLQDRVSNQVSWYTDRASRHRLAARIWFVVSVAASAGGVLVAALRMFGVIDMDLLGVAAAVATAAIAWNQLNQNRNLVSAYRLTARELSIIRDRVPHVDEADWPSFVSDAEDAVSREHTMWLARHGHPGLH